MHRSFKFVLRPTVKQAAALAEMLEEHRLLYNAALQERREAYRMGGVSIRYRDQSAQLPDIRAADPDGQGRWAAGSQQQTLRRLERAFAGFFRRVKAGSKPGSKPGYPRFKGRGRFNIIEWPAARNGARWNSTPREPITRVYLRGVGHVRVHQHRPVRGNVKTVSVKREGRRWYVILGCDEVPTRPLPVTGAAIGVDVGIASFLTTSDGHHVPNPRHARTAAARLANAQRGLARQQRGSKRRMKARARVAALHRKIRRQRLDHAHKTALALVRDHDVIVHEQLRIVNMLAKPSPRPRGDGTFAANRSAAKAGLNRSILDASWGVFLTILAHKAESAGRKVIAVESANTSRTCSQCGNCEKENRVSQACFVCRACGHAVNADENAALNIVRAGLARQAAKAPEKPPFMAEESRSR